MVRPSNPKLMRHVFDAVCHLKEAKGSTSLAIQDYVQQNVKSKKASVIRVDVQRALKHAVLAGLLKLQNGRYKAQLTLKPYRASPIPKSEKERSNNSEPLTDDQNDEKRVFIGDVQDRSVKKRRGKRSTSKKPRRKSSRRGRARKSRRRAITHTKSNVNKVKKSQGNTLKANMSKNNADKLSDLSNLADLADLMNASPSKLSNEIKQMDADDISLSGSDSTSVDPKRSNSQQGKPDQKPNIDKMSTVDGDDSDEEPNDNEMNDCEMTEDVDNSQAEENTES